MNPYNTPDSSVVNTALPKKWYITALLLVIGFPLLLVIIYPLTSVAGEFIGTRMGIESKNWFMLLDAVLSFLFLSLFFNLGYFFRSAHASIVVLVLAVLMAVFWSINSGFIFLEFSSNYPVWYEINVALNDIVAASLVVSIKNRRTNA